MDADIVFVHPHAIDRYHERVDSHRSQHEPVDSCCKEAEEALIHMWDIGVEPTDYQLKLLHRRRTIGRLFRISECCYGKYLMVMRARRREIRTLWRIYQ